MPCTRGWGTDTGNDDDEDHDDDDHDDGRDHDSYDHHDHEGQYVIVLVVATQGGNTPRHITARAAHAHRGSPHGERLSQLARKARGLGIVGLPAARVS